jgi:lipoprotein-releasing system ATP-binding protein
VAEIARAAVPPRPAPVPVVRLREVCKRFNLGQPNEVEVLHDVDLEIAPGDFCAVMGPSGSGKSTLLNLVGLLDRPTSGTLEIDGQETTALDDTRLTRLRAREIGFVFQYHHLLSAFSARENVVLPMMGAASFVDAAMVERADALLERVGLTPWRDASPQRMSGGQQQRVAIARALAMRPRLLLADEPTGNLDSQSADRVFDLLREVNREEGTAILFVTHNVELASRCDRTLHVVDGRVHDPRCEAVRADR